MIEDKTIPILCNDIIFKSLFINNEELLIKLIYDITGYKLNNIVLTITELPIIRKNEKFKKCDILIRSKDLIINIELNSSYYNSLIIKNLNYLCSLFLNNNTKGKKYNKDLEIIQININNYSRFNKPILDYQIINNSYGIVYFNGLKIYDLDIVKSKKLYYNEYIRKRNYLKWGALFSSKTLDEIYPIITELIGKRKGEILMSKLKKMTVETKVMDAVEATRLDDIFRNSIYEEGKEIGLLQGISQGISQGKEIGKEEGISEGKLETTIEFVKKMISNNIDKKIISNITGKSINEINQIIKT
ncbi:MAG: hypothetical protein IJH34_07040 [Romboutsia sp.]|nr:hypothetical protein [Romboutsia sp.]